MIYNQVFLLFLKNCISFLLKLVWIYRGDRIKTNIRKSVSFTVFMECYSLPTNLDETSRNKTRAKSSRNAHLHPLLYITYLLLGSVGFCKSYSRSISLSKCPRSIYMWLSLCVQGWKNVLSPYTLVIIAKAVILLPSRKGLYLVILSHIHS